MSKLSFKVDWSNRSKLRGPGDGSMGELLKKLRDKLAPEAQGLSVSYVDDRIMRKLNNLHREINKTTDVLSFPAKTGPGEFPHLGDIVISLPMADKMAQKLEVSRRREVETLLIHAFLHLCGYDHETDKGEMMALQGELERQLLDEEPLPMGLKRGRKAGSKVKVLKDGTKVVVTGRSAAALNRRAVETKAKAKSKAKPKPKATDPAKKSGEVKRGPGRPRKVDTAVTPRKAPRRRRAPSLRTGVIG